MTNLTKLLLWTLLVINYLIPGTHSGVTVSPLGITVLEGNNATARCKYDGENSLQGVTFSIDRSTIATIFLPNCTFNTLGLDNYITDCEENKTVVITLVNMSRNNHGKTLTCTVFVYNSPPIQSSSSTLLTVHVPVKTVTITSENAVGGLISVCEKTFQSFRCKTSAVRPSPNISWIFQKKNSAEEISFDSSIILERDENHLDIASSTLNVTANISLNNWNIFCSASNILHEEVNSSKIHFNISYPPLQSPSIINLNIPNGETYNIIEGRQGLLTCTVPESNPNANLSWNGLNNRQNIENNIVTNTLEWVASRQDTNIFTCMAKHPCNNYEKTLSVMINVLYPPTVKNMKDVSIIEGSMLNITCNVIPGIPKAATFKWTRHTDIFITDSQSLMIENISRGSSSTYNCTVSNIMMPTIGIEEKGESSGSLEIDVLYPPSINTLENLTLIEGDHLNFSCSVTHGNPNETVFLWTSERHMTWSSQYLTIRNISRDDDMNYICSVYNIMTPTVNSYVKGKDSKMFHLSVQYNATIKDFFVNGYKFERNVTVNEYDNVILICNIDSKPIANTSLRFMTDKTLVWTNSNFVNFTLVSAKCIDAGTYFCLGKNKHNIGVGSTEQLNIFIRCSPRANPKVPYTANLTLASNVTAVLYFPILAYPQPDSVIWQKYSMSNWISLTSNNNINISNNELNVSLSISKMMETDFGRYRLIISNDVGSYIQDYYINAEDRPTPPTGFRVLNKLTTATTATVQWFPSFNGGQPQHFVLNYTKSLKKHWTHKEIEDTGEPVLIYTINGLSSNSIYYIFLYAVNILGSSKLSARLEIKTKEGMHIDGNTSFVGTTIGISVGAVLLLLVLFIGIYTLRRFKLRYQLTSKNVYQNTIGPSTQKINSATEYEGIDLNTVGANIEPNDPNNTDTSTDALPQNPYEKLDNLLKDSNQYSELQQMDENLDDISRKSNADSAPETLQKDFDKAIYMNMKI